jgi:copper transport protein
MGRHRARSLRPPFHSHDPIIYSRRARGRQLIAASSALAAFALFHAALLHSTPAANSHLANTPETIRLVFSEQIVPELSRITLIGADGTTTILKLATDPHDTRTLVGQVGSIPRGAYKVSWRVLSADGHATGGAFSFSVNAESDSGSTPSPARTASTTIVTSRDSVARDTPISVTSTEATEVVTVPILASILRGAGLGTLMAGLGLLFFGTTSGERGNLLPRALVVRLVTIGAILLVAHMIAWLIDISPNGKLSSGFLATVLGSTPGKIEALRVGLALLTLLAIVLSRGTALALALGAACLLVSGTIGHPAGIHPYWTIPAKMVHLLAASAWLGGLLWLIQISRREDAVFPVEARRVSSVALWAVIAILFSGVIQARFFLSSWGDLIHSGYGQLVLIKISGLVILTCYGVYNRSRLLPRIDESHAGPSLSRSVRQEIVIIIILIVIGGFLAYVPTPIGLHT